MSTELAAKILKRCIACSEGGKDAEEYKEYYARGQSSLNPENYGARFNPNNSYRSNSQSLNRGHINITPTGTHGGSIGVNLTGFHST